jgi:carboxyl-terminal processing protease
MTRKYRSLVLIGAGLLLGIPAGLLIARWTGWGAVQEPVTTAQVFQDVLSAIRTRFVDSLTDEELYARAAKGVVSTLGDPYSAFLGPAELRNYRNVLKGQDRSVGLTFAAGTAGLRIGAVLPNSPADRAGLKPGDLVLAIGDRAVRTATIAQAAALLPRDSAPVSIRFESPGDSTPISVSVTPTALKVPAVSASLRLSDSVGYLALRAVSENASREVRDALSALEAWRLPNLVLDLRGNLGGRLDEALAIADLFLAPGQRIGSVSKRRLQWGYSASHSEAYPKLKLVVLVDRHTASSAEIIAAALRDNGRARLLGERTYGKGLIQTTIPLGDSAAIRLTTGRWTGPGGRLITGGIVPDSVLVLPPWEASLRRSLGFRAEPLARTLGRIAARFPADSLPIDSLRFTSRDRDQVRRILHQEGLTLSRRTIDRHAEMFQAELRWMAAARSNRADARKYELLADPIVAAAVAK